MYLCIIVCAYQNSVINSWSCHRVQKCWSFQRRPDPHGFFVILGFRLAGCLLDPRLLAIENGHFYLIYPVKMIIFHSYVSLPEGNSPCLAVPCPVSAIVALIMCKEPDVLVEGHRREANIAEEYTKFINMC